ncbi:MAG: 50S ribosomal protein L24, partial [Arachnia sp.]
YPEDQKVTVEGVNIVKRHRRESQGAGGRRIEAAIISFEAPIHVSNVQLVTKVDGKEVLTRVGYERVDVTKQRADGSQYPAQRSQRIARKTGKEI